MRAQTKGMHEIRKRFAIVVAGVLAMIVSVVGWATAGTVGAAQTPSCLPTSDRMPGPQAFAGVGIKPRVRGPVYTDALQYAQSLLPGLPLDHPWVVNELDALNSEGFVSGIGQYYFSRHHRLDTVAWAQTMQLGSPEQAQAESNRHDFRKTGQDASWKRFTVAAIPGSHGQRRLRHFPRWRLDFTDGDYSYEIVYTPGADVTKQRLASRQVTNAAVNLYNRVHGAAVCP